MRLWFFFIGILVFTGILHFVPAPEFIHKITFSEKDPGRVVVTERPTTVINLARTRSKAGMIKAYAHKRGYSEKTCFIVDMSLPSGRNRFFIYDLQHDSVITAGLVAHGSCNSYFLQNASFSNQPGCGCSAEGKYKIGYRYNGRFGIAYKLYGLDTTNSNAFARNVVLHSYECVPDEEIYPQPICNSLGCAMVSPNFLKKAAAVIDQSPKPVLLYVFK